MFTSNNPNHPSNNQSADLGHSPNTQAQRQSELLAALKAIAPEVVSDNQIQLNRLKELLGEESIAPAEHYELTWAGKAAARREIQKTTSHTLRPLSPPSPLGRGQGEGEAKNAPHMLIEGENLEVLRVLQKSYYGKVKMIYIDPPYNTGNDSFVYPDDYSEMLEEYQKRTGEKNEAGHLNKQSLWKKNSKESGQYHSAWLSMMYPRLYLARNLLRDDGVIFISIDDNEAANLKLLCDEVFGAENFVDTIIWEKRYSPQNAVQWFSEVHDYIIVYAKNKEGWQPNLLERTDEMNARYRNLDNDPRGDWKAVDSTAQGGHGTTSQFYTLTAPNGKQHKPSSGRCWLYTHEVMQRMIAENRVWFGADGNNMPSIKRFITEVKQGVACKTLWTYDEVGHNQEAKQGLKALFKSVTPFETPKPVRLISRMLRLATESNSIILDFFAGSGTTAQAVMELNLEDGGNRQCICVQLPEVLEENSEAYKAGYRTIADITRARIDIVIAKLKAEHPDKTTDLACAQFTLAPSNFKVWRSDVNDPEALREQLALFQQAEKNTTQVADADAHAAMLAELLLKFGLGALGVQAQVETLEVAGGTVYRTPLPDNKTMWLCFSPYTLALKEAMLQARPTQVVLLNSCFSGPQADELLANLQLELLGLEIGLTLI